MAGSLADVFDRRANGLNLLRLVLAAGVIVWHSFPLTGHDIGWPPARQLMSSIWVDGFFAISGFLIAGSWLGRPDLLIFLRARMLRLLPGFYVCILFTAFILAPLMVWLTGAGSPISFAESWAYVRANGLLWVTSYDIGGSPEGIPYPNVWNGSLWTLAWEGLCYLGVAVLGILGLLRRRWVAPALLGVVMLITILIAAGWTVNGLIGVGTRFAIMFLAGVTVQLFADQIPARRWLTALSAMIVVAAAFLPDYRLVAAFPLTYLLIIIAAGIRSPRLQLRNDISYGLYVYAFPVQQSLAMLGLWQLGVPAFAVLSAAATVPFAAASWFGVERYALKLKASRAIPPPAAEPLDAVVGAPNQQSS